MIHTFFPFIHWTHHLTHQVFFFCCFVLKLYTKSSPPQSSFLFHHSTKSLSFFLSLSLSFFPPPLFFLSLRTGSLQHAQVIVLFCGPQFKEARRAVVKFEGSTLGGHGAREHCHYCVEVSWVVTVTLHSPCSHADPGPSRGSWPRRPCTRAGATASCSSSASLRLLQPLDFGTAQRQLVEELFSLWT